MGKNGFYLHQVLLSKAKDGGVGLAKGFLRASMLKKYSEEPGFASTQELQSSVLQPE